jgi:hypothetical protein
MPPLSYGDAEQLFYLQNLSPNPIDYLVIDIPIVRDYC